MPRDDRALSTFVSALVACSCSGAPENRDCRPAGQSLKPMLETAAISYLQLSRKTMLPSYCVRSRVTRQMRIVSSTFSWGTVLDSK